jgi:hypothetical protein
LRSPEILTTRDYLYARAVILDTYRVAVDVSPVHHGICGQ